MLRFYLRASPRQAKSNSVLLGHGNLFPRNLDWLSCCDIARREPGFFLFIEGEVVTGHFSLGDDLGGLNDSIGLREMRRSLARPESGRTPDNLTAPGQQKPILLAAR